MRADWRLVLQTVDMLVHVAALDGSVQFAERLLHRLSRDVLGPFAPQVGFKNQSGVEDVVDGKRASQFVVHL